MAPKKRKISEVSTNRDLIIKPKSRTTENRRITRSLAIKDGGKQQASSSPTTRRSSSASATRKQASSKKKGKKPNTKPPQKKPKLTPKTDDNDDSDDAKSVSLDKSSDSDDGKKSDDDDDKNVAKAGDGEGGSSSAARTTIIIERCTQCQSFKQRANEATALLEQSIPGINVLINPDKPRKGCFEIRAEDGKAFVSLQDMKRPFKPMKDLDMDEVVADIVKQIGE